MISAIAASEEKMVSTVVPVLKSRGKHILSWLFN